MMELSSGSSNLPLPVFARNRRRFLPQSRRLLLALVAAGTVVSLYLLYTWFALVIEARDAYPTYPIPPNKYEWKVEENAIDQSLQFTTMGFYVRDWSLQLGWNNLRYIIEASLLHAHILNRTLVLPSFVYARSCEFKLNTCAAFAPMVNRGDTLGWNPWWENLPHDEQMGWRIPIEIMIDVEHLRKTHPLLLVREYLTMHGLNQSIESLTGKWEPELYHTGMTKLPSHKSKLSLFTVPNENYDPSDFVLVDVLPVPSNSLSFAGDSTNSDAHKLEEILRKKPYNYGPTLTYDEARAAIAPSSDDQTFDQIMLNIGWKTLYTYQGAVGHEYTKSVVEPIREVAPKQTLRGFWDNYGGIQADVLYVAGEIHHDRKPGFLRFTQEAARNRFTNLVLHVMKPVDQIFVIAEHASQRMRERVKGRSWMGAHMRRKDFIPFGWVLDSSIEGHTQVIKNGLNAGRHVLETLNGSQVYNVPGMELKASRLINQNTLPHQEDPFFLATDERAPEALRYLHSQGALRLDDLLTPEDRQLFGWPLLLTDVVALIDQAVLVHAEFLYATGLSSLTGGVINMRAARGADPRTAVVA